jgi:hypothetical protein
MSGLLDTILKEGHQRTKQSLVPIGPVVSEMKIFLISLPFFRDEVFLIVRTQLLKIFSSETTWPLKTKL